MSALDATDDTLQAKTVLTRVGETLFDMQGSDTSEVYVDGGMLQGTGQKQQTSRVSIHQLGKETQANGSHPTDGRRR